MAGGVLPGLGCEPTLFLDALLRLRDFGMTRLGTAAATSLEMERLLLLLCLLLRLLL